MTRCPPRERLQDLLCDRLNAAQEKLLEEHVRACEQCQQVLDELTSRADVPDAFCQTGGSPSLEPFPLPDEVSRQLKENTDWSKWPLTESSPQAGPGADSHRLPKVAGYEILDVLGRGGMGVVYKARDLRLGRIVALKMIVAGAHADAKSRALFHAEAEAVARLQHPHIVQIHEIGESEGLPYLSLEYLAGGSLAQWMANGHWQAGNPDTARQAARLVAQLAEAVHYAHQQGIVHRDLKPGNILLQRGEGREERGENSNRTTGPTGYRLLTTDYSPKIADFGLAKQLGAVTAATQTRWGASGGTPRYMAPEQSRPQNPGAEIGPEADVYALGAILYELSTGRPLFDADTPIDLLLHVLHKDPVPPRRIRPAVPLDLETICLHCLEKEPAGRYASALELALDLNRFLAYEPIAARKPSAIDRGSKFARRNPGLVGGILGLWRRCC